MARRSWDDLSASYRRRLERGGLTQSSYENGASLESARGHAETPEHPGRALAHPERYRKYLRKRQRTGGLPPRRIRVFNKITRELIPYLEDHYIGQVRRPNFAWNVQRIQARLRSPYNPETGEKWSVEAMDEFLAMNESDFDFIDWRDDEWSFLWYH